MKPLADFTLTSQASDDDFSISSSTTKTTSTDEHAPEAIVKKENRAVHVVRFLVIALLMTATGLTSYFVYKFTRDSEQAALDDAFDSIGLKLTTGLVSDTSLKVSFSRVRRYSTRECQQEAYSLRYSLFTQVLDGSYHERYDDSYAPNPKCHSP